nr:MAG TPA: hypothetical protein [Caudoviricetes sp.]
MVFKAQLVSTGKRYLGSKRCSAYTVLAYLSSKVLTPASPSPLPG